MLKALELVFYSVILHFLIKKYDVNYITIIIMYAQFVLKLNKNINAILILLKSINNNNNNETVIEIIIIVRKNYVSFKT